MKNLKRNNMKEYIKEAKKRYGDSIYDIEQVDAFIEGVKWQAERMYSKKEVMDMFDTFSMYLPLHYKFLLEEELKKE
jgi:hypothetical protein